MPGFAAFTFGLLLHAHSLSMLFYVNGLPDDSQSYSDLKVGSDIADNNNSIRLQGRVDMFKSGRSFDVNSI